MTGILIAELQSEVLALLDDVSEGEELDPISAAPARVAVVALPTTLDLAGAGLAVDAALDLGATPTQLQELLVLVSGIGIHTLIGTSTLLVDAVRARDAQVFAGGLEVEVAEQLVGQGGREARVAEVAPDFWPKLLRLSSVETVRAVAAYRAASFTGVALAWLRRELIGIAVDSMPTHWFLPTLLVHVRQAVLAGAGRRAIRQVVDIGAATALHPGVR